MEQIELPTEEDTEQPIDVYGLKKSERVLLKAVWENGLSESHCLPESVEKVRQKYDMTGREYDHYWRLAAGSLTPVLHNNAKARRKLRNIESQKEKSGEYSIVPKRKEGGISSHGALMREAIWLSKTMGGFPVAEMIPSQRAAELQHARDREQTPKQVAVLQNAAYQRLEAQKKAAQKESKARDNYRSVVEGPRHGQRLASTSEKDSASNTKVEMDLGGLQDARDRKSPARKKGRNEDDYSAVLENLSYSHKLVSSSNTKDRDHRSGSTQRSEEMVSRPRRKTPNGEDYSALLEDISQAQRPVQSSSTKSMDGDTEPVTRLESKQEVSNDEPLRRLEVGTKENPDYQEIQRQVEGLFDDMEKHPPIVWSPDTMDNISNLSLNKNDEYQRPGAKRAQKPKTQDAQLLENEARKAERRKKLRELSQQRIELQKKRDELKEKLRQEEEDQLLAKKARDDAPLLARQARIDKEASSDLGDVLDVAMERDLDRNRPIRNRALPIRRIQIEGLPSMGSRSIKLDSPDVDAPEEAHEQYQDTVLEPVSEQSTRPSNDLYLSVPPSGEIPIDSSLTLTLNSDRSTLQSQVRAMQSRLSASYPRIDALPYNIAESENKQTLQTWLKVLAGRWQSRFEDRQDTAHFDPQLKAVLDRLVRDHDLSNDAAIRMAEKWIDIFERRSAKTSDVGEEIEASGMSFLRGGDEPNDSNAKDPSTPKTIPIISPSKLPSSKLTSLRRRLYSTSSHPPPDSPNLPYKSPSLPHLTPTGSAHMVSVSAKAHTTRTAIAIGTVHFSNATPLELIQSNSLKKGDVLSVSRIAGIMAAKKCPDLIPLCHPIALTHVGVELQVFSQTPLDSGGKGKGFGGVNIEAKVECTGQTGVEMEALTSVMGTALSVVDMCKAVDKGMVITDVRVVVKEGGRSGVWREDGWVSWQK
jgi:molybdenum cofactor biosynthesis protein MoaC